MHICRPSTRQTVESRREFSPRRLQRHWRARYKKPSCGVVCVGGMETLWRRHVVPGVGQCGTSVGCSGRRRTQNVSSDGIIQSTQKVAHQQTKLVNKMQLLAAYIMWVCCFIIIIVIIVMQGLTRHLSVIRTTNRRRNWYLIATNTKAGVWKLLCYNLWHWKPGNLVLYFKWRGVEPLYVCPGLGLFSWQSFSLPISVSHVTYEHRVKGWSDVTWFMFTVRSPFCVNNTL